ncbi:LysE family translocator [Chitinophagaceae bacterium LWZ2-11]
MLSAFIKGISLGLLLAISVGPVIFSIIKQSLNNGHKAGYIFVAGVSASDITLVSVANLFAGLLASLMSHEKVIGIVGSIFLILLGIYTVFFKKTTTDDGGGFKQVKTLRKREMAGIFVSAYLMNTLNPGAFLFWMFWSAAIIKDSTDYLHPLQYKIIVFGTCLLFVLFSDVLKVVLAGKLRSKLTFKTMHRVNILSGLILIGFGIVLLVSSLGSGVKMH